MSILGLNNLGENFPNQALRWPLPNHLFHWFRYLPMTNENTCNELDLAHVMSSACSKTYTRSLAVAGILWKWSAIWVMFPNFDRPFWPDLSPRIGHFQFLSANGRCQHCVKKPCFKSTTWHNTWIDIINRLRFIPRCWPFPSFSEKYRYAVQK